MVLPLPACASLFVRPIKECAHCALCSLLLRVRGQEYGALAPKLRCVMTQRQTCFLAPFAFG
jgi:hypothetical protein